MSSEENSVKSQATEQPGLKLLLQDDYAGTETAETLIIRNEKVLRSFFSKVNRTRKPGIPVPEVDFTKEMILIYCSGKQKGGAKPQLRLMEENSSELRVQLGTVAAEKAASTVATTSPFSVYSLPVTEKKIRFEEKE